MPPAACDRGRWGLTEGLGRCCGPTAGGYWRRLGGGWVMRRGGAHHLFWSLPAVHGCRGQRRGTPCRGLRLRIVAARTLWGAPPPGARAAVPAFVGGRGHCGCNLRPPPPPAPLPLWRRAGAPAAARPLEACGSQSRMGLCQLPHSTGLFVQHGLNPRTFFVRRLGVPHFLSHCAGEQCAQSPESPGRCMRFMRKGMWAAAAVAVAGGQQRAVIFECSAAVLQHGQKPGFGGVRVAGGRRPCFR